MDAVKQINTRSELKQVISEAAKNRTLGELAAIADAAKCEPKHPFYTYHNMKQPTDKTPAIYWNLEQYKYSNGDAAAQQLKEQWGENIPEPFYMDENNKPQPFTRDYFISMTEEYLAAFWGYMGSSLLPYLLGVRINYNR